MPFFIYEGRRIHFEEHGTGKPVIFCHGNTASSKMFSYLLPLYEEDFHCILIDFLGCGGSERIQTFPPDIWIDEALQLVALTRHLALDSVSLIGTSGGAWAAMNAALLMTDRVAALVADSFDGRTLDSHFPSRMLKEREKAMKDEAARGFYEWCIGSDWQQVVEKDTSALLECAQSHRPLFTAPLSTMKCPVLLTGSEEDEMCRKDMEEEYVAMARLLDQASIHMFAHGGHPAMVSNAEDFAALAKTFIMQEGAAKTTFSK